MQPVSLFSELRIPTPEEFEQELLSINNTIKFAAGINNHWRIRIGKITVNYYPYSQQRTIYINAVPGIQTVVRKSAVEVKDCFKLVQELCNKHLS